jgi:hypothetical protein
MISQFYRGASAVATAVHEACASLGTSVPAVNRVALPTYEAAAERLAQSPLERVGPHDEFHDYVLTPYVPPVDPTGKLRSVNLLYESFALAGVEREGARLVDRVRAELGAFRTVFGIKRRHETDTLAWELYFYDPGHVRGDLGIERLVELLAPMVAVDARPPRALPWHMLSVEVDVESLRGARAVPVHVYVDTSEAKVADRSYELLGGALELENLYTFHQPAREIDEILARLRAGVHWSAGEASLSTILFPELFECHSLCVANKRRADAIYCSRLPTPRIAWFLRRFGWPAPLVGFVDARRRELDHLLWDVGYDYRFEGGRVVHGKSSVYGSF